MKKECWNCVHSEEPSHHNTCATCFSKYNIPPSNWEAAECWKPDTHADRIRAMSDKELVPLIRAFITTEDCPQDCINCAQCSFAVLCGSGSKRWLNYELEWLQQPAEEET